MYIPLGFPFVDIEFDPVTDMVIGWLMHSVAGSNANLHCTLFGLMGVVTGDTSLSDWSPASSGDDEKPGDWCIPSCSGDAEDEEQLSSSKTSDGSEGVFSRGKMCLCRSSSGPGRLWIFSLRSSASRAFFCL